MIEDNSKIHLEHIMPKKIGDWNIDEETHQSYLHRLGNLTLLGNEYNTRLKNKTFDVKKQTYVNSKIELTKSLCDFDHWTPEDIEYRQEQLFEAALKCWNLEQFQPQV